MQTFSWHETQLWEKIRDWNFAQNLISPRFCFRLRRGKTDKTFSIFKSSSIIFAEIKVFSLLSCFTHQFGRILRLNKCFYLLQPRPEQTTTLWKREEKWEKNKINKGKCGDASISSFTRETNWTFRGGWRFFRSFFHELSNHCVIKL